MRLDVRVDERTVHEVELRGFEAAVAARATLLRNERHALPLTGAATRSTTVQEHRRDLWDSVS